MLRFIALLACLLGTGCAAFPDRVHQPTLHNPFPQVSRVGVATFFNLSSEPKLDGRKVAEAYAAELAEVPGYTVISTSVVDTAAQAYQLDMRHEDDVRRLAQILDIDAVVVGTVTEYTPYYPPRMTLTVAWFAANPAFHSIPAGYGLPWGTAAEKDIPGPLAFQAEFALAKEQLKTQTPVYQNMKTTPPADPSGSPPPLPTPTGGQSASSSGVTLSQDATAPSKQSVRRASHEEQLPQAANPPASPVIGATGRPAGQFPPDWPDPHGFIPRPPSTERPRAIPCDEPIMQQTKSYRGNDVEFTTALEDYYYSRDDARLGGWQNYLRRSDDFMRFCCRMHIWEMLGARGGAGETRVVWRWSTVR
jgi:hypothetical protein